MLKNKQIISILIIIVCLVVMLLPVAAENSNVNEEYNYPITPEHSEWKNFNNLEQLKACEIPENTLKAMSTEALVNTVLKYPKFMDIYSRDNLQKGLNQLYKNFNGLQELLKRKDASKKLLIKYKQMKVLTETNVNSKDIFMLSNVEALLSQKQILNQFNIFEKKELANEIAKKYFEKQKNKDIYGFTKTIYYRMIEEQKNLLSEKNSVTPKSVTYTYVKTPNGTSVLVSIRGETLTNAEKASLADYVKWTYPKASLIRQATTNYNCHSYAWYSSASNNKYWMNRPVNYWLDKSYQSTSYLGKWFKLYYKYPEDEHSAIISSPNSKTEKTEVYSKWGAMGLYRHTVDHCPYYHGIPFIQAYYKK